MSPGKPTGAGLALGSYGAMAKKGKKKGVKKGPVKKGKKGEFAFRNNFMREGADAKEGREDKKEPTGADEEAFEMR